MPVIGIYPKNQRMISMTIIATNIDYCVSISFGVIG